MSKHKTLERINHSNIPDLGGVDTLMNNVILDALKDMQAKKNEIIQRRLLERGIEIDFDAEAKARFKKVVCESHVDTGEEIYYYDDGTPEGLRIVTFLNRNEHAIREQLGIPMSFSIEVSYY